MRLLIVPALAAVLLAGCATTDSKVEPQQEKEFVTGSNIPRKDRSAGGVSVLSKDALERMQNSSGGPTTRGSEIPR
ncbi:MAG: hypothetical protein IPI73_20425 [Betaproteobacteria bacterium]|nr:hypothetical protein [Betaproteobacteria bacterium]